MSDSWKPPNPGLKLTAVQLDGTLDKSPLSVKVHKRVLEEEVKTSIWALAIVPNLSAAENYHLKFKIAICDFIPGKGY